MELADNPLALLAGYARQRQKNRGDLVSLDQAGDVVAWVYSHAIDMFTDQAIIIIDVTAKHQLWLVAKRESELTARRASAVDQRALSRALRSMAIEQIVQYVARDDPADGKQNCKHQRLDDHDGARHANHAINGEDRTKAYHHHHR